MKNWKAFVVCVAVPYLAAIVGSFFTSRSVDKWYIGLKLPLLNPPDWVFPVVWNILFLFMGLALYLVYSSDVKSSKMKKFRKVGLWFFGIQLVLNVLWSFLFFYLQNPLFAFVEIFILWIAIFLTTIYFFRVNRISGILFLPYLAWVGFASYLNWMIVVLNEFV